MPVINLSAYRGRTGRRATGEIGPPLADIMKALHHRGGALHRSAVVRQVASWRGLRAAESLSDLNSELIEAFEDYIRTARRKRTPPLLEKPLGADSHRWALTDAGRQALHDLEAGYPWYARPTANSG